MQPCFYTTNDHEWVVVHSESPVLRKDDTLGALAAVKKYQAPGVISTTLAGSETHEKVSGVEAVPYTVKRANKDASRASGRLVF